MTKMTSVHGLINRAVQCFIRDTAGPEVWADVARGADLGTDGFESMMIYPSELIERIIQAALLRLDRPRDSFLEDFGTYLVSHPNLESVRRLLRFGGSSYVEFMDSLEDLPDRGRLAVPRLNLPEMEVTDLGAGMFGLTCSHQVAGAGHVIVGLLRAMADDYGALVVLEHLGLDQGRECISVHLLDQRHWSGKRFDLAAGQT